MPLYVFENTDTGDVREELMSIASMEQYLSENPNVRIRIDSPPAIGDTVRLGLRKPSDNFRDRLKDINRAHRGSINTF